MSETSFTPTPVEEAQFGQAVEGVQDAQSNLNQGERLRDTDAFKQLQDAADAILQSAAKMGISVPRFDDQTGREYTSPIQRLAAIL